MTKNDVLKEYEFGLIDRINRATKGHFVYKGEIFDGDGVSIDYIPDLAFDVATFIGMDDADVWEFVDDMQDWLYNKTCAAHKNGDNLVYYYLQDLKFELFDQLGCL